MTGRSVLFFSHYPEKSRRKPAFFHDYRFISQGTALGIRERQVFHIAGERNSHGGKKEGNIMKFFHLGDLHLGKRVNGFPMLEDQKFILGEILEAADTEHPEAVVIAGDVYDKPVPPVEAVRLLDWFLSRLSSRGIEVLMVSGNHDSPERLGFLSGMVGMSGIHIGTVYREDCSFTISGEDGDTVFYMLPFVKPAQMKRLYPEDGIETYTDAVSAATSRMDLDPDKTNILVAHQCAVGGEGCDSEEISIGGSDNVGLQVFEGFDYVALGHLHRPQDIIPGKVRYAGTPLKYSFSEAGDRKSLTVVEVHGKSIRTGTLPLRPLRDMAEISGDFDTLSSPEFYLGEGNRLRSCYLHITLTDKGDVLDAVSRLRAIYPYLMKLDYGQISFAAGAAAPVMAQGKNMDEMFLDFFVTQNGGPVDEEQAAYMEQLIRSVAENSREE